jgi:hypothetical protein
MFQMPRARFAMAVAFSVLTLSWQLLKGLMSLKLVQIDLAGKTHPARDTDERLLAGRDCIISADNIVIAFGVLAYSPSVSVSSFFRTRQYEILQGDARTRSVESPDAITMLPALL